MKWKTFSDIEKSKRYRRAKKNYHNNVAIGIKLEDDNRASDTDFLVYNSSEALLHSNVLNIGGTNLLQGQSGGNFPLLKFSFAKMSMVICEVMATYNAMKLSGYINGDDTFNEFFKASCEFEVNAPYIIPTGHFGSDYKKIGTFLRSRGVTFSKCKDINKIDELIKSSSCCIVSYRFSLVKVHTFCCFYDNNKLVSINRGSGCLYVWKNNDLKECLGKGRLLMGYAIDKK